MRGGDRHEEQPNVQMEMSCRIEGNVSTPDRSGPKGSGRFSVLPVTRTVEVRDVFQYFLERSEEGERYGHRRVRRLSKRDDVRYRHRVQHYCRRYRQDTMGKDASDMHGSPCRAHVIMTKYRTGGLWKVEHRGNHEVGCLRGGAESWRERRFLEGVREEMNSVMNGVVRIPELGVRGGRGNGGGRRTVAGGAVVERDVGPSTEDILAAHTAAIDSILEAWHG